jgi:lipopolysaccharide/colanic/teichoic acid biosynthesis glycosyltransferase
MRLFDVSGRENGERPSPSLFCASQFEMSSWTRSGAKRAVDVGMVLVLSPLWLPVLAAVALAVCLISGPPVLFRQQRAGLNGGLFVIYKFRTMRRGSASPTSAIATDSADRITWLGKLLRKSKMDELPQIINVLAGEMSLVGPRPKVPEQQPEPLPCRPGLTGPATLAFAREEVILQSVALDELEDYYYNTILPAKARLDGDYLRSATVWTDLRILVNTVTGRWETYRWDASWLLHKQKHLEGASQTASLSQ